MPKIKEMFSPLARFWLGNRIWLIIAAALAVGVVFFGLHDAGIILGILGAIVILVGLTYRWRRIRNYIILFFSSFLAIIFLAFLDEVVVKPFVRLFGGADAVAGTGFEVFNQIISLFMLFFGVAGLLTGFFGTVILSIVRLVKMIDGHQKETGA